MEVLNRKVPIKNILYMFSYVWEKVSFEEYTNLDSEDDFDSVNILSTLFLINVESILKRGLYKEYREKEEELRGIRGKINFEESLNRLSFENAKAVCIYDELNENNLINQVIKTTAIKLHRTQDINNENLKKLSNVLLYFNQVDEIEITNETFKIKYNQNNEYTHYLINICELINNSLMLSENKGSYKFINILDDDKIMQNVYEKFVYKFYNYHLKKNDYTANVFFQKHLNWEVYSGNREILPEMRLDTLIQTRDKTIIIDTKYYESYYGSNYGKLSLNSSNLYQMYTYMNHIDAENQIEGMLLYPQNGDAISEEYNIDIMNKKEMKKAKIRIQTIDLSKKWNLIEEQLLSFI